jgi:alanine racemase
MAAATASAIAEGSRPLMVGIDVQALQHNLELLRDHLGKRTLMAVLKGDAYGHGIDQVAPHLIRHCSYFGVVDNREAQSLRKLSPGCTILRLRPATPAELDEALRMRLGVREAIGSLEKAREIATAARHFGYLVDVHVSMDVGGLGRGGMSMQDEARAERALREVIRMPGIRLRSLGCHLPEAGTCDVRTSGDPTRAALERFENWARRVAKWCLEAGIESPEVSALSSAGSAALNHFKPLESSGLRVFERIGNSLYGLGSSKQHRFPGVQQVMHAATMVSSVIDRPGGASIGYEATYTTPEGGESIALLGVGWLSLGRLYQGVGKSTTPCWVVGWDAGRYLLVGRQSMNIATLRAVPEDGCGRPLRAGDVVFVTTDGRLHEASVASPTIPLIAMQMGGVQEEHVTSLLGTSPSTMRFCF